MEYVALTSLLRLLEGTSVAEIEHDDGRTRIRLTREVRRIVASGPLAAPDAADAADALTASAAPLASHASQAASSSASASASAPPAPEAIRHAITAGLVGTFYRSPAPDQPPFVGLGDVVQEGQTLAIVEAMKLLNSIDADRAGRVVEIVASDATSVTADTVLFVIEPLESAHV